SSSVKEWLFLAMNSLRITGPAAAANAGPPPRAREQTKDVQNFIGTEVGWRYWERVVTTRIENERLRRKLILRPEAEMGVFTYCPGPRLCPQDQPQRLGWLPHAQIVHASYALARYGRSCGVVPSCIHAQRFN